jgi:serine/threonine-protein kinase
VTFGKYHVLARLGRGGMGDVFLVVDVGPADVSKLLVVKELREDLSSTPEARSMFLDEARLAVRINHPNVVQTFGVVEDGDSLYLIMEFVDGQPLERILRGTGRGRFSQAALLHVLADALAGLHYAHELTDYDGTALKVVHRDVNPQNIIVTYDGSVKLVDFGIANAATGRTTTESGVFKGTLRFSAPEQATCAPVDRRVDVFAVGAVLWEILAGRDMWHGLPDAAVMLSVGDGRIPSLRDARPDLDPALVEICEKALAPEPDARFATASELRSALVEYLARRGEAAADLGPTLAEVFADERLEMRRAIDLELKKIREGSPLLAKRRA